MALDPLQATSSKYNYPGSSHWNIPRVPTNGTCPLKGWCSWSEQVHGLNILVKLASIVIDDHLRWHRKPAKKNLKRMSRWFMWLHHLKIVANSMSAKKSENSWCQCWMAVGIFSASILVITDLVVVSLVYPLFPHLWKIWEKGKWIWLGWGRESWFTADKRCYYEVPKAQYETADIIRKVVTMVAFENKELKTGIFRNVINQPEGYQCTWSRAREQIIRCCYEFHG